MVHNWVSTGVQMAIQYLKYCTPIDHKSPPIWGVGALGKSLLPLSLRKTSHISCLTVDC